MINNSFSHCHTLPTGTCLNQSYCIQDVLGVGGFGITYSGIQKDNGILVAIKEYFPSNLAVRTKQEGQLSLSPFPPKNAEVFNKGLLRFLNEAQILKELQGLESIVSVYDLFEENGTAYIVMEYIEGLTLNQYVKENGIFTFPEISKLISPVIQSLAEIHKQGLIHRDISPDNLILGTDNKLHLIDFGAASHENSENKQNTVILKAGYAPPEQYIANGKVGTWTDVYALCATIYFTLTGTSPSEAIQRLDQDSLDTLSNLDSLLPWQKIILEKGLHIRPASRFRDMQELHSALMNPPRPDENITIIGSNLSTKNKYKIKRLHYPHILGILTSSVIILSLFLILVIYLPSVKERKASKQHVITATPIPHYSIADATSPATQTSPPAPHLLTMPDVTNSTLKKARQKLKELDSSIQIKTTHVYSTEKKAGQIISQSVTKGTSFSKGQLSSILLTVSKGKESPKKTTQKPSTTPTDQPKKDTDYNVKTADDYTSIPLE